MKKVVIIFLGVVSLISSCYYDNEEELYTLVPCDTVNVRYSAQINSILQTYCFGCHGGTADLGSGIKLGEYSVIKQLADNGILLDAITRNNNRMPKGGAPLPNCKIAEIRTWIRNGAPNN
jgi:mono/diheme cytochrome c family protein